MHVISYDENTSRYLIGNSCPFCGSKDEITVDKIGFDRYNNGELIQRAFPYLSADEREFIKTGICADCWP